MPLVVPWAGAWRRDDADPASITNDSSKFLFVPADVPISFAPPFQLCLIANDVSDLVWLLG